RPARRPRQATAHPRSLSRHLRLPMAKILKMPLQAADRANATTAPQDVLAEDAATFDVLRRMREDILCCVLKPDQRLRFGELRQRYATSVGTLREALS